MLLLNSRQVANQFAVSQKTVQRWVTEGRLPAIKTIGGQYRIGARMIAQLVGDVAAEGQPAA